MARLKKTLIFGLFPVLAACSPRTIALRTSADLMERGAAALYEEEDVQFAKEALPGQIKLAEGMLASEPDNRALLLMCAEGFGSYAFSFLEDSQPDRAKRMYIRGRDHGLRLLSRSAALKGLGTATLDQVKASLASAKEDDVPAMFWTAFNWAGYVNLARNEPAAVADLPKAVALMQRVHELSPDYHFAGADLFFGSYYASRPAILGGDVNKAKAHFMEARRRTGGKFLMTYVLEARYYAVAAQDVEMYRGLLGKVKTAEAGTLPNARLTDEVAKRKAATLMEKIDDYF
jgi:hypothetical protein